eukprot:TRINITY_DN649_c2_g1_i1.p1 TRINITY_DN649_c2_g1~~TRINITY_DN649_c2_g1_i1.p1  ORF type:complete len:202 (-),score=35.85 TRINITY_DN649_c2_g1_i1:65-586(-)
MGNDDDDDWKINVIGDKNIGKSSFILYYINNTFTGEHIPPFDEQVTSFDLSTATEKRYQKVSIKEPTQYDIYTWRLMNGFIFCYDLTRKQTLSHFGSYISLIVDDESFTRLPKAIVGLKCDEKQVVEDEEVQTLLQKYPGSTSWIHKKVSAKTGEGIKEVFNELAAQIRSRHN